MPIFSNKKAKASDDPIESKSAFSCPAIIIGFSLEIFCIKSENLATTAEGETTTVVDLENCRYVDEFRAGGIQENHISQIISKTFQQQLMIRNTAILHGMN